MIHLAMDQLKTRWEHTGQLESQAGLSQEQIRLNRSSKMAEYIAELEEQVRVQNQKGEEAVPAAGNSKYEFWGGGPKLSPWYPGPYFSGMSQWK